MHNVSLLGPASVMKWTYPHCDPDSFLAFKLPPRCLHRSHIPRGSREQRQHQLRKVTLKVCEGVKVTQTWSSPTLCCRCRRHVAVGGQLWRQSGVDQVRIQDRSACIGFVLAPTPKLLCNHRLTGHHQEPIVRLCRDACQNIERNSTYCTHNPARRGKAKQVTG